MNHRRFNAFLLRNPELELPLIPFAIVIGASLGIALGIALNWPTLKKRMAK